jgi:hypothetical protein
VDEEMSKRRTKKEAISVEIIVSCFLRWIGGGVYLDIRTAAGISIASFYRHIKNCIVAINQCPKLYYHFPKTSTEMQTAADGFKAISSNNAIEGCVACIDGFLLKIKVPASKEVGNVKSFFSGHYQTYGINVQAACDCFCRFVEVCVAAPGGANNVRAFKDSTLYPLVESLPIGKFVIGDNAYVCTESLLTPFSGPQKQQPEKDTYNFYLSQLRIRIEMAFGLLVTKWRILKSPLQIPVDNIGNIFVSITKMHNYCINEGSLDFDSITKDIDTDAFIPSDHTTTRLQGNSLMREIVMTNLQDLGLRRPEYNLKRNTNNNE